MRNPNGYGTVAKLSGARRRPFIVKKVSGWKDNGQPIYSIIGYTETRETSCLHSTITIRGTLTRLRSRWKGCMSFGKKRERPNWANLTGSLCNQPIHIVQSWRSSPTGI